MIKEVKDTTQVKAILVYVSFDKSKEYQQKLDSNYVTQRSADLQEFRGLATSAGANIVSEILCRREAPDPKYFVGTGKLDELYGRVVSQQADTVVFNKPLSPAQERNLELYLKCKVLDSTKLILNIFAQRARSFAGKLQVELAQLQHMTTRLVRGWTHLERQRGGIGLRSGPGETQLEADRRVLRQKIVAVRKRLVKLEKQRTQNRRARKRAEIPTVALVGYTNAGKSTLFNRLVAAGVKEADQLFTTLDPTLRRIELENFGTVILADTVGFIRNLPHELVEAFHATLEETCEADLLLHVIDASDPEKSDKIEVVNGVLETIGANHIPQLLVFNKIDLLENFESRVDFAQNSLPQKVWISTLDNLGLDLLCESIKQLLSPHKKEIDLGLLPSATQVRAALYKDNLVIDEHVDEFGNFHLKLYVDPRYLDRYFVW